MNFVVSLAKIPGGLFAAIFLRRFSTRPVFLASALLIAAAHLTMGLTNMAVLPSGTVSLKISWLSDEMKQPTQVQLVQGIDV